MFFTSMDEAPLIDHDVYLYLLNTAAAKGEEVETEDVHLKHKTLKQHENNPKTT